MTYEQPDPAPSTFNAKLSHLAAYAATLDEDGLAAVRASLEPYELMTFEQYLNWQQSRDDDERSAARQRMVQRELAVMEIREEAKALHADNRRKRLLDAAVQEATALLFEADVLDADNLDSIEIPDPLIEGFIDKESLVRVYGPSRSLKSFVALDMAGCVASGIAWHGNVTHQSNVLYIVAEGKAGIPQRVRAWEAQNDCEFRAKVYPHALQINDEQAMSALISYVKLREIQFVIFDTQARCTVGVNENDNTEMGSIVAALDALKEATGACVTLVHHSGNEGGKSRGATAVFAAMDSEFEVKRDGDNTTVKTMKRKDGPEAEPLNLVAVERHVTTAQRGEVTSLALASGHVTGWQTAEVVSIGFQLTSPQAATLLALSRYRSAGAGPTDLARDQNLPVADRSKINKQLGRLADLNCAKQDSSKKWYITDRGWKYLESVRIAARYPEVPDDDE